MNLVIEDIINDPDRILWCTNKASKDIHRYAVNYADFEKRLKNYKAFHIIKDNNKIIAFAGIYKSPLWSKSILRICDRMFIFRPFRIQHLRGFAKKIGLCSGMLLPFQTRLVLEWGKEPFFSAPKLTKKHILKIWLNKRVDPQLGYKLLPDLYYTCSTTNDLWDIKCWQNIIAINKDIDLPKMNTKYYEYLKKRKK